MVESNGPAERPADDGAVAATETGSKHPSDSTLEGSDAQERKRPKLDQPAATGDRPTLPSPAPSTEEMSTSGNHPEKMGKATNISPAKKTPKSQVGPQARSATNARSKRKPIEQSKSFADTLARMSMEARESEEMMEQATKMEVVANEKMKDAGAMKEEAAKVFAAARLLVDNMAIKHKAEIAAREKKIDDSVAKMQKLEASMRGMAQNLQNQNGPKAAEVDKKIAEVEAKLDLKFTMCWVRLIGGLVAFPKDFTTGGLGHALSEFTRFCLPAINSEDSSAEVEQ